MKIKYLNTLHLLYCWGNIAAEAIKPSKATLESNVGEMQVEMQILEDGSWKLTSLLDGGSIVRREESEIFKFIDNQIQPIINRLIQ